MDDKKNIFIYGVPGVGKTSLSRALAGRIDATAVEADVVRKFAWEKFTREQNPFAYLPTTDAYQEFGELSKENAVKGLLAVRTALAPFVEAELKMYGGPIVMEGAFLDPLRLAGQGKVLLVITSDEILHHSHFFEHRAQDTNFEEKFKAARMIQEHLISEAGELGVTILENNSTLEEAVRKLME